LIKKETLEEINTHFSHMFQYVDERLKEKKDLKYQDLLERIADIVNQSYMDPNLSINTIADEVKMSSSYLRRLYKKLTSKSIADYINEVRMNNAKKLLIESSYSINEISERSGFVNRSYFHKAFKRINGITPSEYRQKKYDLCNKKSII
jgi:AraC-like DNA-binding protein